jgi:hypothetical protein
VREKHHQEEEPRGRRRGGSHDSKSYASILTRKRSQTVEKNHGAQRTNNGGMHTITMYLTYVLTLAAKR